MKATTLLVRQHGTVKAIFKKLESGKSDPAPLLKELSDNLAAHMVIEQDIFYPAVKSIDEDLVNESYEEHSLAEIGLKRLLATNPKDEAFKARVTSTKELIEHHVEEEEEDLFPKCEKRLGDAALEELGAQMKARFDELVKAGFEEMAPKGFAKTSSDISKGRGVKKPLPVKASSRKTAKKTAKKAGKAGKTAQKSHAAPKKRAA